MKSKTIMLVLFATTLGVVASLESTASIAHDGETPTSTAAEPNYRISPAENGDGVTIILDGAHAVLSESQVSIVGSDGRVLAVLPEWIAHPTGEISLASYDVSDPRTICVSLARHTTDAKDTEQRRVPPAVPAGNGDWDDSWEKCVSGAGISGAIAGGIGAVAGGPVAALGFASIGLVAGGVSSMFVNCAGKHHMHD